MLSCYNKFCYIILFITPPPPPTPYKINLLIAINKFGSFLLTPPPKTSPSPLQGGGKWRKNGGVKNERRNIQNLHSLSPVPRWFSTPPLPLFLHSPPFISRKLLKKGAEEKVGRRGWLRKKVWCVCVCVCGGGGGRGGLEKNYSRKKET